MALFRRRESTSPLQASASPSPPPASSTTGRTRSRPVRERVLQLAVSDAERSRWSAAAGGEGKRLAGWIRRACDRALDPDSAGRNEVAAQLWPIGSNLNQLTRYVNESRLNRSPVDERELATRLEQIRDELRRLS